jgi:hypothetical protein
LAIVSKKRVIVGAPGCSSEHSNDVDDVTKGQFPRWSSVNQRDRESRCGLGVRCIYGDNNTRERFAIERRGWH